MQLQICDPHLLRIVHMSRCMLLSILGRSMWRGWQNLHASNGWQQGQLQQHGYVYFQVALTSACTLSINKNGKRMCLCRVLHLLVVLFVLPPPMFLLTSFQEMSENIPCKFPNILRMQNATDLNHISNESLLNGLSVYIKNSILKFCNIMSFFAEWVTYTSSFKNSDAWDASYMRRGYSRQLHNMLVIRCINI